MIQRIQSLYLLLAGVVQVLFATGTYFTYKILDDSYFVTGSGTFNSIGEKTSGDMKTLILGIGIAILALTSIFLFKNRKQQMKLSRIGGLLTMAEIVFIVISYFNTFFDYAEFTYFNIFSYFSTFMNAIYFNISIHIFFQVILFIWLV